MKKYNNNRTSTFSGITLQKEENLSSLLIVPRVIFEDPENLSITTGFIQGGYSPLESFLSKAITSSSKPRKKLDGPMFMTNLLSALYQLDHHIDYVDLHANLNNIGFREEDYSFVFYEGGDCLKPVHSFQYVVHEFIYSRFSILDNKWFIRNVTKFNHLEVIKTFLLCKGEEYFLFDF